MTTLHIFSKPTSHYSTNVLDNLIKSDDIILLVSDACYASKQFLQFPNQTFLLKEDLLARSIDIADEDMSIEYDEFVNLTLVTSNTISW